MTIDGAIAHAREVAKHRMAEYENHYDKDAHYYPMQCKKCAEEHEQLAEWLEELKQYHAIGTVEELKQAKKYVKLAKNHGTVGRVIDACAEYEEIGTVEECRAAVGKQKAKKMESAWCPCCGKYLTAEYMNKKYHCIHCGQKLDWSDEE